MKPLNIGLGLLSWRAHETLIKTLESYQQKNFTHLFKDRVIYFSDISDEDRQIAESFNFRAVGGPNKGIAEGTENLVKAIGSEHVLIVQNDNPLIASYDFSERHLRDALQLLTTNKADIVRLRHQWHVGEGFSDVINYLKYFPLTQQHPSYVVDEHPLKKDARSDSLGKKLKRLFRSRKAHQMKGRSIFIEESPEKIFPEVITREGNFLIVDSSVINFSDQCFLTSKDFFLNVLMDYVSKHPSSRTLNGFQVPEICLNSKWWRDQHFKIAQGTGLFTHDRFDGSFRENHHAFDENQLSEAY